MLIVAHARKNLYRKGRFLTLCLLCLNLQTFAGNNTYSDERETHKPLAPIDASGRILGEQNTPLAGASIRVKGKNSGTSSDQNGNFTLRNVDDRDVLEISYTGYATREVRAARQLGDISLSTSASGMTEVTVTGYTNYRRDKSPSAVAVVGAEKINTVPGLTFDQILQGRVPGMSVLSAESEASTAFLLRFT
jgi:hypothetical protein